MQQATIIIFPLCEVRNVANPDRLNLESPQNKIAYRCPQELKPVTS